MPRQDNTIDLVRMAQAALSVDDIHTHDEDMDLDQPAISTVLSTPPATNSVSTSSATYRQSSENISLLLKHDSRSSGLRLSPTSSHQNADSSAILLGSLSTFMETRGVSKPKSAVSSPYFSEMKNESRQKAPTPEFPPTTTTSNETPTQGSLHVMHNIPFPGSILQGDQVSTPALLFLSSSLLKTHTRLIHHLETSIPAPRMLYREYTQIPLPKTHIQTTRQPHNIPPEADVIISPNTGIVLTTSQGVTQLYLPGHKPDDPHVTAIKGINSPLRERIFRLLPRYERLYVLISHAGTALHTEGHTHPLIKIDVRTLQGISSLSGFCASFSKETTVVPLLVQSSPEIVAEWILGLAATHRALVSSTETQMQSLSNVVAEGLDYVHDRECHWEIFLRQIGLNPFAARAVLDMDAKLAVPEDKYSDTTTIVLDSREVQPSSFAAFIEMSSEHRISRFGPLIGSRVLRRVETAVEPLWEV